MTTYKELAERLEETMHDDAGFHLAVDEAIEILRSLDAQKPIGYWGGAFSIEGGADLYEVEQVSAFGRVYKNLPLYAAPVAAQPTKHYRTLRGNWTNTTTHVCNHCGFETRSEHRIVAHQCDVRKAAQPQAKPLSDAEILGIAEPFGAFEFGDAQGNKRLDFASAAITAFCLKNGIKERG